MDAHSKIAGTILEDVVVPAGSPWGRKLSKGQHLRIIDLEGKQAVDFLCYDADLYSLKPVLLLDTAWLGAPSGFSDRTVASVGGGLEATIVVVNFDVIYAHTVYDSSNQNTNGNLIFQLSYQKIF